MSYTATHRHHHIHVPWMTVIAVAVAVAVAAAVLILVNQPATQTATTPQPASEAVPAAMSADAAVVPAPESPALRRQLATELSTRVAQEEQFAYPRNHVIGTSLGAAGSATLGTGGLAIEVAPNDPHPLNHFPSEP